MNNGSLIPNIDVHVQEILLAGSNHDIQTLEQLIQTYSFPDCKAVDVQDSETGCSPLHAAIAACETEESGIANGTDGDQILGVASGIQEQEDLLEKAQATVKFLLENGAIWNQLDRNNETPGCIAYRLGLKDLYRLMVDAGVRAELLLTRLEEYERLEDDDDGDDDGGIGADENEVPRGERDVKSSGIAPTSQDAESTAYLSSTLSLSNDKLIDDQHNGVMMAWESDIMSRSADAMLYAPGLKVLNVGFGMGIIDTFIQNHANKPTDHHIIEAHPDVLETMRSQGWYQKPGVTVHEGLWQDLAIQLVMEGQRFDAVYFDTFAESYSQFREFFQEHLMGLLELDGRWSFFNGMGADRQISYDVYQHVVEMDLFEAGFDVEWQNVALPPLDQEWKGVRRKYWNVEYYRLPVCRYME